MASTISSSLCYEQANLPADASHWTLQLGLYPSICYGIPVAVGSTICSCEVAWRWWSTPVPSTQPDLRTQYIWHKIHSLLAWCQNVAIKICSSKSAWPTLRSDASPLAYVVNIAAPMISPSAIIHKLICSLTMRPADAGLRSRLQGQPGWRSWLLQAACRCRLTCSKPGRTRWAEPSVMAMANALRRQGCAALLHSGPVTCRVPEGAHSASETPRAPWG